MFARHVVHSLAVCIALSLIVGCTRAEYEVEMSLDDEGLHRRLTAWEERTENDRTVIESMQPAELDTLRSAYGADGQRDDAGRMVFEGVFDAVGPSDVGGMIAVARWTTSLGTLTTYNERVRGADDLVGRWEEGVQEIDRFCELLGDWAQANAVDPGRGAEVNDFINGPLRDDLKNVAMHSWTFAARAPSQSHQKLFEEFIMRMIQFGIEHNYITVDDVPTLYRLGMSIDPQEAVDIVVGMLDYKRGEEATPLTEVIPVLQSVEVLEASLAEFFEDTPEAAAERRTPDEELETAELLYIPFDLIIKAMLFGDFLGGGTHVSIRFAADQEPFLTNGEWDPETQSINWSSTVESRGESPKHILPTLCYATWAVPDAVFQRSHFGRVVFIDQPLATYIIWHEGLDQSEAAEWDEFIAGLTPDDDLRREFERFRFGGEPASTEEVFLLSDVPRQLLDSALETAD